MLIIGLAVFCAWPQSAWAVPSFARKYGTSCTTCHTVFPKLTPFGEAFRRNGFRFPGTDSDMVKQPQVSLGSEAYKKVFPNAVWPGSLPGISPISVGFNGEIVMHPKSDAAAAAEDNGAAVVFDHLVDEAQIFAAGSFDDAITYFAELAVSDEGVEIEHALVYFNDLFGPAHAVNLWVGKNLPTLSTFGPHSTYLADMAMPMLGVTGLFGATSEPWTVNGDYPTVELEGTANGVVDYSVGINGGSNSEVRSPRSVYAHLGAKFGGVRLDAEDNSSVPNPAQYWAETSLALDAFYAHSSSRFTIADPMSPENEVTADDVANVIGGSLRAQWLSLELDAGLIYEAHDNPSATDVKATAISQYDELSYVVYPWLVPAVRFELTNVKPDGGTAVTNTRIMAGIAAAIRPNMKLVLSAALEQASGGLAGGWGAAGGATAPADENTKVSLEVEEVNLGFAYAY